MTKLLWRVEDTSTAPQTARWQQGITLHLLFQSLTLIVARRDGCTRHYLALSGCSRCRPDGCDRVCHRVLFEQLVRTTLPGVTLIPTPRLVPRATETQRLLAVPRAAAQPLDAAFLAQWDEGRLSITWSGLQARAQPIRVGALLALGAAGPDPRRAIRAHGWSVRPLHTLLSRAAFTQPVPAPAPISGRAGEPLLHALRDPQLFMGGVASDGVAGTVDAARPDAHPAGDSARSAPGELFSAHGQSAAHTKDS